MDRNHGQAILIIAHFLPVQYMRGAARKTAAGGRLCQLPADAAEVRLQSGFPCDMIEEMGKRLQPAGASAGCPGRIFRGDEDEREETMGYCSWAGLNEANRIYHDTEWGVPVHDDRHMFEHLTLECLQCGLSWDLMLKKREIFQKCFDNFDYDRIAAYGDADVERILNTGGMIRSPRKVRAVIKNAREAQKIRGEYGSLSAYFWSFTEGKTILYQGHDTGAIPVSNGLSDRISRDLKKRGFKYVGAVTIYSHLQACGIINDHDKDCPCWKHINEAYPTVILPRDQEVMP